MKHEHAGARQKCGIDLEGRILRGGTDQHDVALFHGGQKGVLLCLVQSVDFVDKQQGAAAVELALLPRLGDEGPEILDTVGNGGIGDETTTGGAGDHLGQAGFAATGRPPEDGRTEPVLLDQLAQRTAGGQ
jgi:hypothetical protein